MRSRSDDTYLWKEMLFRSSDFDFSDEAFFQQQSLQKAPSTLADFEFNFQGTKNVPKFGGKM